MLAEHYLPYFYPVFFLMSSIAVACNFGLFVCSIDLICSRLRWSRLVSGILIFEVLYFLSIPTFFSRNPTIGDSVGAAVAVGNGGLAFQFYLLLPFWVPFVLWRLRHKQRAEGSSSPGVANTAGSIP
jgi:hypothetical protein